jgi:hypothetical protein
VIRRDFYRSIKSNTEFRFLPYSKLSGLFTAGYARRSVKKIRNKIMRYAHTNIAARDWKKLSDFYIIVFNCTII